MKNILIIISVLTFLNSNCQNKITTQAKFTNVFEFANIHDYTQEERDALKQGKDLNELPESLILNMVKTEIETSIKLLTKLKIICNNETHIYIKYSISKQQEPKTIQTIDLIMQNNIWGKNTSDNLIFMPINKILNNVNAAILFEFYNKNNTDLYPEVNKLKSLVKDENGILDIYKLANVIEKNKTSLSKYLDE